MKYIVKTENETLEQIVYNYYGSIFGNIEQVLLANRKLSSLNVNSNLKMLNKQYFYLPVGTEVLLPDSYDSSYMLWSEEESQDY